jgi:L-threonylcarbamoyladenylate synthase
MYTEIIKINADNPEKELIQKASNYLKEGGLCVFPTETVYGLGANALLPLSVQNIYLSKGRPNDNPLIMHVSDPDMIKKFTLEIPEKASILIEKFMPGPLTIILKKNDKIPNEVTAGLDTVAIRMPGNTISLELIKKCGFPIAAQSANISGKPSPTNVEHVIDDLYLNLQ